MQLYCWKYHPRHAMWFVAFGLSSLFPGKAQQVSPIQPLSRVSEVRRLSPEDAAKTLPIRLRGTITALSGWKNSFFLQDSSGAISVDRTDSAEVQVGDNVDLAGVSGSGMFAPVVVASRVDVLAQAKLPQAKRSSYLDLAEGNEDSQRVEVRGVVRDASIAESWGRRVLFLTLSVDGASITARVYDFPDENFNRLVDATVTVRGVCGTIFNDKRQLMGVRIFVPRLDDIQVESKPIADPFGVRAVSVRTFFQFAPGRRLEHRVKILATLTFQDFKHHRLYLQSGSNGLLVDSSQTTPIPLGSRVEVVGFLGPGQYPPVMQNAIFRQVGEGMPLAPVSIRAEDVIQTKEGFTFAPYSGQLTRMDGQIVEKAEHAGEQVWLMQDGNNIFRATISHGIEAEHLNYIAAGTRVRLTGICLVETGRNLEPASFTILLRSAADVNILEVPWRHGNRALWIIGILIVVSLCMLAWILQVSRWLPSELEVSTQPQTYLTSQSHLLSKLASISGLLCAGIGAVVLTGGWALQVISLRSVLPGYASMKPNTALGLLAAGCALWNSGRKSPVNRFFIYIGSVFALAIGALTLAEYVMGIHLRIDELLFRDVAEAGPLPGRMAAVTAFDFLLVGCSLMMIRQRRLVTAAQALTCVAVVTCLVNLVGQLYGVKNSFAMASQTGMAANTTVALLILCVGILLSRCDLGLMVALTSQAPGGVMARRLLPAALLFPTILGWLRWQGEAYGLYDTKYGLTLFACSNIVVFAFLIWTSAGLLNRSDTDRCLTEVRLRESEAGFRQLADAMPQIVWTAKPDGSRDYSNSRWTEFTGMTFEQTKDRGWMAALHPDDVQPCVGRWIRSIANGTPYQIEWRFRQASAGVYRWHLGRAVPIRDAEGVISRWFGTCTDIEDYKQAEQEIRILNDGLEDRVRERTAELDRSRQQLAATIAELNDSSLQLQQSNLELQDFASVAAHDLQEPLRKVQAFGGRLKTSLGTEINEQAQDYIDRMLNATQRMQSLIRDLLKFARVTSQANPFLPVDLARVTREVLSDLEVRIAEENALVEVGCLPTIDADALQMRQLLQNLIGNALKFHQEGKPPVVRVYVENADLSRSADGMVQIVVEDQGIGFDEKYLDRIFTVFQRLHGRNEYEGTGVGLAICRKIALRHGGDITAKSTPGQGSSFVVALPFRHADQKSPLKPPAAAYMNIDMNAVAGTGSILISAYGKT
jgi:PAS domain S-box-containing protein